MHATYDRVARLEDCRQDNTGWGSIDLGTLLAAWGFLSRDLGSSGGRAAILWYHPSESGRLNITLLAGDPTPVSVVSRVIWLIDELVRLGRI